MSDHIPSFTIKAKDALAVPALTAYADLCEGAGLHEQAEEVYRARAELIEWQEAHLDQVQNPDHKHVDAGNQTHRLADTLTIVRTPDDHAATLYIDGVMFPYATVDGLHYDTVGTRRRPSDVQAPGVTLTIVARRVEVGDERWEAARAKGRTEIHVEAKP